MNKVQKANKDQKPELTLVDVKDITAEDLADVWEKLTGEKSTPESITEFKALIAAEEADEKRQS
jgi:hypothetical protein